MKKLTTILFFLVLVNMLVACVKAPTDDKGGNTISKSTTTPIEKRETANEVGKPIIYIGSFSSGSFEIEDSFEWLTRAVRLFNNRNQDYEARVIDYGDSSVSDAMYRLNAEIITGSMPDMLVTHGMPIDNYANLDLLYDMTAWLEPEEFFTGPLEAMKTEGKLYEVSPGITVTTFYGLNKYLNTVGAISLENLYDAWEIFNISGDKGFVAGLSNEIIAMLLISAYEEQFINRSASACNFISPEFIKLLEFCKKLPANPPELNLKEDIGIHHFYDPSIAEMPELHYAAAVRNETALLGMLATSRLWHIPYAPHNLVTTALRGTDYRYIGYPGANTASVYLEFPVAVSAKSANIEGAKAFVDDLWTMIYMLRHPDDLPVMPFKRKTISQFIDRQLKRYETSDSIVDELKESGEYEKYTDAVGVNLFSNTVLMYLFDLPASLYTVDDYAELEAIINTASVRVRSPIASYIPPFNRSQVNQDRKGLMPSPSSFLNPIIAEEIQSYFAGVQDANRTAGLIQSRYSIYLSEQGK
jgi:hypothetical protein